MIPPLATPAQVAGNIGLINPLIFNHFGYGTYAQVATTTRQSHEASLTAWRH